MLWLKVILIKIIYRLHKKEKVMNLTITGDAMGRPLHDLRISLLDQCNFRCPYCMPEAKFHADYEFLKRHQRLTYDEIIRVATSACSLGVSKIRLTGGEPLLDKNICDLIERIVKLSGVDDLALTTNGILLSSYAEKLAAAGLHRVTVSLDSIDKNIFHKMSGGKGDLKKVLAGIKAAENIGLGWVSIVSNDVLKEQLELPEHIVPVAYLCLGHVTNFEDKPDLERSGWLPRLELKDVVYYEKWEQKEDESWNAIQEMIKSNLNYA